MFKIFLSLISLTFFSTAYADFEIGGTLYTNHAFHAEKGKSYTTNYRAGNCIPRGSEVAVLSKTSSPKQALKQLATIEKNPAFRSYLPYYTTKAELHFQNKESKTAIGLLNEALKLPLDKNRKTLINNTLQKYSKPF